MRLSMVCLAFALTFAAMDSAQCGFDLSIGNIATSGTGATFDVIATATGQNESVSAYTLQLNATAANGTLSATVAETGAVPTGFTYIDTNANNAITALDSDNVGFSTFTLTGPVTFTENVATTVGSFTFTAAGGLNPGEFIDLGFVFGAVGTEFSDSQVPAQSIPINVIGGTGEFAAANPLSTRIGTAVPEPSSLCLLGLASVGVVLRRRRA